MDRDARLAQELVEIGLKPRSLAQERLDGREIDGDGSMRALPREQPAARVGSDSTLREAV